MVFQYDGLNRLTNMIDGLGATAFTWTPGDQLAGETGPFPNDAVSYTYNNRLRSGLGLQQPSGSWNQSYAYDPFLRVTNVTSFAGSFGYQYVAQDPYGDATPVAELNAANNGLVRSYAWGLDLSGTTAGAGGVAGLVEVSYYGSTTTNCFVAYDGNGNVAALVNAADGTAVANYEYDPFGQTLRATGPMATVNPFRFSTKRTDNSTDLVLYEYRAYNPTTGRWLSRDPIGEYGGLNVYAFLRNPITVVDRLGLQSTTTYTITDHNPPNGTWLIHTAPLGKWNGFTSTYVPGVSPPCPCRIEDIIIAQAVHDATGHPAQFDTGEPGTLPPHQSNDPIPAYSPTFGKLGIIDAPHIGEFSIWPLGTATWRLEDCAVCRTHPNSTSTDDKVLGCVRIKFEELDIDDNVRLSVEDIDGIYKVVRKGFIVKAKLPGTLWKDALADWRKRGTP